MRDLLHVADLVDLLERQLLDPEGWRGFVGNVGGGRERSLPLREATEICRELTGNEVEIAAMPETRPGDVPLYVSDCGAAALRAHRLAPAPRPREVLADTVDWTMATAPSSPRPWRSEAWPSRWSPAQAA